FRRPPGAPISLAFRSDGKLLAVGWTAQEAGRREVDAWVALWNVDTGAEVERSKQPHPVVGLAFVDRAFDAGQPLLAACRERGRNEVLLPDGRTGKPVGPAIGVPRAITSVAFSPDGQRLALEMPENKGARVAVWGRTGGLRALGTHGVGLFGMAFHS